MSRAEAAPLLLLAAACGAAACGSSAGGVPPACTFDPPGMFRFHVHNAGDQMISWNLGCRRTSPIVLHLPEGDLPTGSEAIDFCGFTCEQIYARGMPGFCTDCGPGYSDRVAPGGSALIDWDRRVYTSHTLDPACRPPSPPQEWPCALGHAVTPSPAQSGTITICPGTVPNPNPGACQDASGNPVALRPVEFTVDTTGTEAVIEVR